MGTRSGFVYLMQRGEFYKIGYTRSDPQLRLASLQTANPEPITLLGFVDGGLEDEQHLHAMFASKRVRGEWFALTDDDVTVVLAYERRRKPVPQENLIVSEPTASRDAGDDYWSPPAWFMVWELGSPTSVFNSRSVLMRWINGPGQALNGYKPADVPAWDDK